jgi:hypothetical protein
VRRKQFGEAAPVANAVLTYARDVEAACYSACNGPNDVAIERSADARLRRAQSLAAAPSASRGDVALKVATMVRLRLENLPCDFDQVEQVEFVLLTSCLTDLVLGSEL